MKSRYNFFLNSACSSLLLCSLAVATVPTAGQQVADSASASGGGAPTPVASTYIVGAADVLRITIWKQPEISQSGVVVRPDGIISVPLVGEVKVSGMTPVQIEATLVEDLKQYVNEPRVTVTVAEIGSKMVYVTGEVQHPGAYPLVGPLDILQVIAKAGGVTPYAHRRSVFVLRQVNGKKQKIPVNYGSIFRGKNPEQNLDLQPGDTVIVP
jgi:polysaccharide export outer membrane protein